MPKSSGKRHDTSWGKVHEWYDRTVGETGLYYQEKIILPNLRNFLREASSVLDVACGQGIVARNIKKELIYKGLDISPELISRAKSLTPWRQNDFFVHDAETAFDFDSPFSHAILLLALQNMENPEKVLRHIHTALEQNGRLIIILNHPCFRIPKMSGWSIDPDKKLQSRRLDRYMSCAEIAIRVHPSQGIDSPELIAFHRPLSYYSKALNTTGFCIELIEEWCSDKISIGKVAKMENRARKEFPLFLALIVRKLTV